MKQRVMGGYPKALRVAPGIIHTSPCIAAGFFHRKFHISDPVSDHQTIVIYFRFWHIVDIDTLVVLMDKLNRQGRGTLYFAGQGIQQSWQMKREMPSPRYTTRWSDLPIVKAN